MTAATIAARILLTSLGLPADGRVTIHRHTAPGGLIGRAGTGPIYLVQVDCVGDYLPRHEWTPEDVPGLDAMSDCDALLAIEQLLPEPPSPPTEETT